MKKNRCIFEMYRLIAFFIVLFISSNVRAQDEQLVLQEEGLNLDQLKNSYKITTENPPLICLRPLVIADLDTVILGIDGVDKFSVEIPRIEGKCNWQLEGPLLKADVSNIERRFIVSNVPNVLSFVSTMKVNFRMLRLLAEDSVSQRTIIPYFIALYDTKNNMILKKNDYELTVNPYNIPKSSELSQDVTFGASFPSSDYLNVRLLIGFYKNRVEID